MYWPKEGVETYGVIQVKLVKEDVMATYTVRTLQIRHLRVSSHNCIKVISLLYNIMNEYKIMLISYIINFFFFLLLPIQGFGSIDPFQDC
jgi:hypothetical protein